VDRRGYCLSLREVFLGRRIEVDHQQARDVAETLRLACHDAAALEVIASGDAAGRVVRLQTRHLVRHLLREVETVRRLPRNRTIVGLLLNAIEAGQRVYHLPKEPGPLGGSISRERTPVRRQVKPRRVAGRVADLAARVLPAAHRARYCDEYRSELHDLAADRASWWQQVMYAVRLLDRSWELRYELRRPAAGRARP
jgi:hypothetical protein